MKKVAKPSNGGRNSQSNTNGNHKTKKTDWIEYLNTKTLQMQPGNNQTKDRFFSGLVIWTEENEEAFDIETYCDMQDIDPDTVADWAKEQPKYRKLVERALRNIGRRREKLGIQRNLNVNHSVMWVMPHYSKVWERQYEFRSKLRNQENEQNASVTVIMEKTPETDVVKVKK